MAQLFRKYAKLQIGNRQFTYPPVDIEFDQKISVQSIPMTEVKLYNPNEDTISMISKFNNYGYGPQITIDAGYEELHGVCANGYVAKYDVKKESVDKILTFHVADQTLTIGFQINKTYKNQSAETILKDMFSKVGIKNDIITLGKTKIYASFTAMEFNSSLINILKDTNSMYFCENGVMSIYPGIPVKTTQFVYLLSPDTGLVNIPEKSLVGGMSGIKFQTLFLYNLHAGSVFKMQSSHMKGTFKIWSGKKRFSSFQKSECEYEAITI